MSCSGSLDAGERTGKAVLDCHDRPESRLAAYSETDKDMIDSQTNHPSSSSRRLGAGNGAPEPSVVGRRT
jgi:hypothetical protein